MPWPSPTTMIAPISRLNDSEKIAPSSITVALPSATYQARCMCTGAVLRVIGPRTKSSMPPPWLRFDCVGAGGATSKVTPRPDSPSRRQTRRPAEEVVPLGQAGRSLGGTPIGGHGPIALACQLQQVSADRLEPVVPVQSA